MHAVTGGTLLSAVDLELELRRAGRLQNGDRVESIRPASTGGFGMFGRITRLEIVITSDSRRSTLRLIVKEPAADLAGGWEMALAEARFYEDRLPEKSGVESPTLYFSKIDESAGVCVIALEDLGDQGFVRQFAGCTPEQASAALSAAAVMHSRWWRTASTEGSSWIPHLPESAITGFCRHWMSSYNRPWPEMLGALPGRLSGNFEKIVERLGRADVTVVHGDFHSQNVSFDVRGPSSSVRLIDFQCVQYASPMFDVARFITTSLLPEVRREAEHQLLRRYHADLVARGVVDYGFGQCIEEFRTALLWNPVTPLSLHVAEVVGKGTQWPSSLPMIERCRVAIEDWDAFDVLEG
jgi:hypothetical protein